MMRILPMMSDVFLTRARLCTVVMAGVVAGSPLLNAPFRHARSAPAP
jgi:hypothetical protein